MTFEEVGQQYTTLKNRFDQQQISAAELEQAVKALVATAPDGKRWQIEPFTGAWIELSTRSRTRPQRPSSAQFVGKAPDTLLKLFLMMLKNAVKSLPKLIIIGLVMSSLTWVAHTYIIAKINDGLMYDASRVTVNSIVHLQQTYFPGVNAFWGVLSYFLTGFVVRIHSLGPKKWFNSIIKLPRHIKQSVVRKRRRASGSILLGVFIALLIGCIYRNFMLSWILAFGTILIMTAHFESLEALVLKLSLTDLQRMIKRKIVVDGEEYDSVFLLMLGMAGGFALAGVWRTRTIFIIISALLFLALLIVIKKKELRKAALGLIFVGSGLLLLDLPVLAWCEGGSLSQSGGNWLEWWGSYNADLVRRLGRIPALVSFIGSLLGGASAAIASLIPSVFRDSLLQDDALLQDTATDYETLPAYEGGFSSDFNFGGPDENPFTKFTGGDGPGSCSIYGLPNYWVNTATLNLVVRDTVFAVESNLGPEVRLSMTYNSISTYRGIFGPGWSFSYEWLLEQKGKIVAVCKGSGQRISFTFHAAGSMEQPAELQPPVGVLHRLIDYGDFWIYLEKDRRHYYRFDRVPGTFVSRLTVIADYYGNTVQFTYDPQGNLTSIIDAAGRIINFTFNAENLCTSFGLPDGRQAVYSYDTQGRLVQAVDLLGVTVDYSYDSDNSLTGMIVGRSRRSTIFSYRRSGRQKMLAAVTNANGDTTSYELITISPRRVKVTDPEGNVTIFQSIEGMTEAVTDPLGYTTRLIYHNALPVSYQDQNGLVTRWDYDQLGRRIAETDPAGNRISFDYDGNGNLLKVTDPLGWDWRYRYNDKNSLVGMSTPAGRSMAMNFDQRGLLTDLTAFDGRETVFEYDRFGNLTKVTEPDGYPFSFAHDQNGYFPVTFTDQLGHTTAFEYDANGRPVKKIYPDGTENSFVYDCCYRILSTDERGRSRAVERDANGNTIKVFNATGAAFSTMCYNRNNKLISYQDECGRSFFYKYDAANRLSGMTNALGQRQLMKYEPNGKLSALWVEGDRRTTFKYDRCNRLAAVTDTLGSTVSLERDALGRVVAQSNARGKKVSFAYDPDGQLETVSHDGQESGRYHCDAAGQLLEVQDECGKTVFGYDQGGRLTRIVYPGKEKIVCGYNFVGLIDYVTYPADLTVHYQYDCRERPVKMNWGDHWVKFEYDPAGNLVRENRSNGTHSVYSYDDDNRLATFEHHQVGEKFIERSYRRDASGNILEERGYQPVDPPADEAFKCECNAADQAMAGDYFSYDADGNLVAAGTDWAAVYDAENRMVEITRDNVTTRFTYNALGQRVRVKSSEVVRNYYYDPVGNLLFESTAEGEDRRCYLYCHGRTVAMVTAEGGNLFYHYDQSGNTLALTDAQGKTAAAYAYSPFGIATVSDNAIANPFTFCGAFGVFSEGKGLYFMKNRHYAATWGRFVQKDPLGLEGGINAYVYAANNPLSFIDPEGTLLWKAWVAYQGAAKVVGILTLTVGAGKAAYNGYNTIHGFNQTLKTKEQLDAAFIEYRNIVNTRGATLEEKDAAYQRYSDIYNKLKNNYNKMLSSAENATTNTVEVGIGMLNPLPDELTAPGNTLNLIDDMVPSESDKRNCTGIGAGGAIIRKKPKLPFHYIYKP